jgi:hypothetical protein
LSSWTVSIVAAARAQASIIDPPFVAFVEEMRVVPGVGGHCRVLDRMADLPETAKEVSERIVALLLRRASQRRQEIATRTLPGPRVAEGASEIGVLAVVLLPKHRGPRPKDERRNGSVEAGLRPRKQRIVEVVECALEWSILEERAVTNPAINRQDNRTACWIAARQ